jgi:uncharacterized repeat protein (TIGR01451 family)
LFSLCWLTSGSIFLTLLTEPISLLAPTQAVAQQLKPRPMQTYFVPLPETDIFYETFDRINAIATAPVMSIISVSISTDNTIVWYDEWEDDYDQSVDQPGSTTKIWGDGIASNGCAPGVTPCTNTNDRLRAGQAIILENWVDLPRNNKQIRFDGGDRIQASFPIAVTRAQYPKEPGSLLAGAAEVFDTMRWGREFVAPVGQDIRGANYRDAFEYTALYMMAEEDDTIVTLPDGSKIFLDMGKSHLVRVNMGAKISADHNIQVHVLAGDIGSTYEMRWFALVPAAIWSSEYITPVGDSTAETKVVCYNGGTSSITVDYQYFTGTTLQRKTMTLAPNTVGQSLFIPTNSGARFNSTGKFIALSTSDTLSSTSGQIYDWGFPVMPRSQLSSQVLIGWGYGCTGKVCVGGQGSRSVVWITPTANADLYIDYNNDGVVDSQVAANYLSSTRITDTDNDMTGAMIWATVRNTGPFGTAVDIAAAWGQDGSRSFSNDNSALDLGTLVVPFYTVTVKHFVELLDDKNKDGVVNPGDTLLYTIRIQNLGQVDVNINGLTIINNGVPPLTTYIPNSVWYKPDGGAAPIKVPDKTTGTPNPLDAEGIPNPVKLTKRGGTHEIVFAVTTQGTVDRIIPNNGFIVQSENRPNLPFAVDIPLVVPTAQPKVANNNNGTVCIPLTARRDIRRQLREEGRHERRRLAEEAIYEA